MPRFEGIAPVGGTLVQRTVAGTDGDRLIERARALPPVRIDAATLCDLALIGSGAFSPLRGFLGAADYRNVVEHQRLADGTPWPVPICLRVAEETAAELREGSQVALAAPDGGIAGVLDLAEKYAPSRDREVCLAGEVHVVEAARPPSGVFAIGEHASGPPRAAFASPARTRALFRERGWRSIVGFAVDRPMHRGDEYVTKCALEMVDGLLLHACDAGPDGDPPRDVTLRCLEALVARYYPCDRVMLATCPWRRHGAGAWEVVLGALVRRNYGCTHVIVGRGAQAAFDAFTPSELGIVPLRFEEAFHSALTGEMATVRTAPGGLDTRLPATALHRAEVAQILDDYRRAPRA